MNRKALTAVAVSGGVDSLYSLLAMREAGYNILALHGIFQDNKACEKRVHLLGEICHKLKIPFKIAALAEEFNKLVIQPFIADNNAGLTPNPCILCNYKIKFGLLKKAGMDAGCSQFATGHYARLSENPYPAGDAHLLAPPTDATKNQNYFLSMVTGEQFADVLFPLSAVKKNYVGAVLDKIGVKAPEAKESQDICFMADKEDFFGNHFKGVKGQIFFIAPGKLPCEIGAHAGLENYTIGQRRGLGIAWKKPLYVIAKIPERNSLYVADKEDALATGFAVADITWHVPYEFWPAEIFARPRYRSKLLQVKTLFRDSLLQCEFYKPQLPVAPGQIAAFYDKNELILAAGKIIPPQSLPV